MLRGQSVEGASQALKLLLVHSVGSGDPLLCSELVGIARCHLLGLLSAPSNSREGCLAFRRTGQLVLRGLLALCLLGPAVAPFHRRGGANLDVFAEISLSTCPG